ncbi:MAG: hypothetical protein GY943_14770 [Chloroflexi bacterium]|nr:hypothetical protein [Chloroflexota bacterium]
MQNKVLTTDKVYRWSASLTGFVALLFSLLLLTACFGGSNETDAPAADANVGALTGQVVLQCTKACAARGQCGTAVNGTDMVLGGHDTAVVQGHNASFPAGTIANVITDQMYRLSLPDQSELQHIFYQVQTRDAQQAWVAGWCVAAQQ